MFMTQKQISYLCLGHLLLILLACLSGCEKSKAIKTDLVTGVITMDGAPLAGATVTFSPVDDKASVAVGTTDANGKYTLQTLLGNPGAGTTPGDYVVSVSKSVNEPTGKQEFSDSEGKMVDIVKAREIIPDKFTNKKSSPHKATVVSGQENKFDFDVSK